MRLEAIRHAYLRRVVGTALGAIGIDSATSLAKRLARGVFEMKTPGSEIARARLRDAITARPGPFIADAGNVDDGTISQTIDETVSAMYDHIARFWIETLFAPRLVRDSSWRRFVGVEDEAGLRSLADSGRGCLLATAYFGNIAVAASALGQIFRPVHVLVDVLTQPRLKAWQQDLLRHKWIRPIERSEAASVVPGVLADGGAVLLVAEHERPRGRAVRASFLGHTLDCYPTIGRLVRWFDVPVGVVTCRREQETFRFNLTLHEVIKHDASRTDAEERVIRRVMGTLENAILNCPAQYLWSNPVRGGGSHDLLSEGSHKARAKTEINAEIGVGAGTEVDSEIGAEVDAEVLAPAIGMGIE